MRKEEHVFRQLHEWAESEEQIRAMVLTSSRANPHAFRDVFSDKDHRLSAQNQEPASRCRRVRITQT